MMPCVRLTEVWKGRMAEGIIRYDLKIAGSAGADELLEILFLVIPVEFTHAPGPGAGGREWHARGSGGWSFRLHELAAGQGAYHLRVEVDPSDPLFRNTCQWYMHPSKFPDFLRKELAQDALEVSQC